MRRLLVSIPDFTLSSRALTTAEEASGAAAYVIAMDGIAVITDRDNPVTALTTKQLADIYTGQIRDWQGPVFTLSAVASTPSKDNAHTVSFSTSKETYPTAPGL